VLASLVYRSGGGGGEVRCGYCSGVVVSLGVRGAACREWYVVADG
jgi:hypothetical protein